MAGLVVAAIIKDYSLLLWIIPFLIFLYYLGWVLLYHFVPTLPAFSIAGTRFLVEITNKIRIKRIGTITFFTIVTGNLIFGVTSTMLSIIPQVNFPYYQGISYLSNYLKNHSIYYENTGLTIISNAIYLWIPQYVVVLVLTRLSMITHCLELNLVC